MAKKLEKFDVIIVGGGPTGLAFACSIAQAKLNVCILEKEPESNLATPAYDGREIAHTHTSLGILKKLEILQKIAPRLISPIREAKVLDGSSSSYFLNFNASVTGSEALGFIIPNHVVRKAAYEVAKSHKNIRFITNQTFKNIHIDASKATVTLTSGAKLESPLVVAADGRFSPSRRELGVEVSMRDFGRSVIVCRLNHQKSHNNIAHECFNYERTLALLPLPGNSVSAVITLPTAEVKGVLAMSSSDLANDVGKRLENRLGRMKLNSELHVYPLVGVYAKRFIGERFALLGDACVGMHPVTAHGFNFGLKGQDLLAGLIRNAAKLGLDIGSPAVLFPYQRKHRASTLPLYWGTNVMVGLYTDERPVAKVLRRAGLRIGNNIPPIKNIVSKYLADPEVL